MGTINFNVKNSFNINNNTTNQAITYNSGDIISGVITNKDDENVTVRTNDVVFNLSSQDVVGNVKDKVNFEVVSTDSSKLVLKQIKNFTSFDNVYYSEKAEMVSNEELLDMFKKNNLVKDLDAKNETEEEFNEKMLLLKIKRALKFGSKNISKNIVAHLQGQGLNIDKVSMGVLSELISNVKTVTSKDLNEEQLQSFLQDLSSNTPKSEMPSKELIATMLNDNGFEVTSENVNSILENIDTLMKIQENSENIDIKNILSKDLDLTVFNIKNNTYKNNMLDNYPVDEKMINNIQKHLKSINMDSEQNQKVAEVLFTNSIDITKTNINKFLFLKNDLPNFTKENFVDFSLEMTKNQVPLESFNLQNISKANEMENNILNYVDNVKNTNINDSTFIYLSENNIEISLNSVLSNSQKVGLSDQISKEALQQKKLFLETQLKLTYESMSTLTKNGINIDLMPLKDALQALKDYEQDMSQKNIGNTPLQNQVQKEVYSKTISFVDELKLNNPTIVSNVLNNYNENKQFSIKSISKYDNQMDWQLETYSGKNSFSRVEDKIAPFLESINVKATEENVTASGILIRNDIDVTKENLNNVLEVTSKLDFLKNKLSPTIVSKMLQDGFNPVTENVDDIISYIDSFNEIYGDSNNEKLLKELVKINKDTNISEDTKNAIKSVYRALNQVSKFGVASVGALLKEEKELTLHKLIDSSKNFTKQFTNKEVLDVTLENDKEYKKSKITENTNITLIAKKGVQYNKNALDLQNLIDNSNYEGLKTYFEENKNNLDELLPLVNTKLKQINNDIDFETVKEITENISNINQDTLAYLLKNNIKPNRKNINTFKNLQDDVNITSKNINSLVEDTDTLNLDYKLQENMPISEASGMLLDVAVGEVEKINSEVEKINLQEKTMDILNMQSYLSEHSENYFSFPIKLNATKEVANLNMFVTNKDALDKNDLKIHLSLFTKKLKDLSVDVDINRDEKKIHFNIATNNNSVELLKNQEELLKETLNEIGYEDITINYNENVTKNFNI